MKAFKLLFFAVMTVSYFSLPSMAEDKEMTSQEKMISEWMALASPGEKHKLFDRFVGEWDGKITMWQGPDAPPQTNPGTSSSKIIMGGRYLMTKYTGSFMGSPFEGMAVYGYDNYKNEFNSFWIDNFGTGFYLLKGTIDENGTITEEGDWDDPMSKKTFHIRSITEFINPDTIKNTMYHTHEGGKEFKAMEIIYTRKK